MRTMTQKRLPLILLWLVLLSARIFAASDAQQRILVEDGRYVYPDGSEVVLWGVNFQPSIGCEYDRFVKAGLIPRGSFDPASYFMLVDAGLDEIQRLG